MNNSLINNQLLKVFLCHGREDKPQVRELYSKLRKDGVEPWLDEEDILGGQDWDLEIRKAIRASHAIIVCLSSTSVNKEGYFQREIKFALDVADEKPEGTIYILPVKLEECDVPTRLSKLHWIDYFEKEGYEKEKGCEKVVRALQNRASHIGNPEVKSESELHGFLLPSNESSPPNPFSDGIPPDAVTIFVGSCVGWITEYPMVVLQVAKLDLINIKKVSEGVSVSAKVFSDDGRIVADIEDNEFNINPNNYFKIKRPNKSSLIVYDQHARAVLDVQFLNPRAIRVSGIFVVPNHKTIIIDDTQIMPYLGDSSICLGNNAVGISIP